MKTSKMATKKFLVPAIVAGAVGLCGCTQDPYGNQTIGTVGGAATGAAAGAVIGNNVRGVSTAEGAIAGALIGGLVGNRMGAQQDQINQNRIAANQQVVNVRNSNGSYTPVVLTRVGAQWEGPRGELYPNLPSEEQLRRSYGF